MTDSVDSVGDDRTILVLGGGLAGLAAASRLLELGFKVLVVERDGIDGTFHRPLNQQAQWSPAVDFNHAFVGEALTLIQQYFPGVFDTDVETHEALSLSLKDWAREDIQGSFREEDQHALALCMSRSRVIQRLRERVFSHERVRLLSGCIVQELVGAHHGNRFKVSGARVVWQGEERVLRAGAVFDGTGRGSLWPQWSTMFGRQLNQKRWANQRQFFGAHYDVPEEFPPLLKRAVYGFANALVVPAKKDQVCFLLDLAITEDRLWRQGWKPDVFFKILKSIPSFRPWIDDVRTQRVSPVCGYKVDEWWHRQVLSHGKAQWEGYFPLGDALLSVSPTWLLGSLIGLKSVDAAVKAVRQGLDGEATQRYGELIDPQIQVLADDVQAIESMVDEVSACQYQGAALPLGLSVPLETYYGLHHFARSDVDTLRTVLRSEMWLDRPLKIYQHPGRWIRHWRRWLQWRIGVDDQESPVPDRKAVVATVYRDPAAFT